MVAALTAADVPALVTVVAAGRRLRVTAAADVPHLATAVVIRRLAVGRLTVVVRPMAAEAPRTAVVVAGMGGKPALEFFSAQ
jgi:hypothetical protein